MYLSRARCSISFVRLLNFSTNSRFTLLPRTMVAEVAGEEPGVRVFVVQSEERLAYERGMREAAMEKTRQALEKLSVRVAAGRLADVVELIGEGATVRNG